jgi:site-specific DNA-cytosine methylase
MAALQGVPDGFLDDTPWKTTAVRKALANGVPVPMAEAVARAVLGWLTSRDGLAEAVR